MASKAKGSGPTGRPLSVLAVGHTYVQASYRGKWRLLAERHHVDVTLLTPHEWRETLWQGRAEREPDVSPIRCITLPISNSGRNFAHCYHPRVASLLWRLDPDIVHVEEEPWSAAAGEILLAARLFAPRARRLVFTWENAPIRERGPRRLVEKMTHALAHGVIAGSAQAAGQLRVKGFRRTVWTLPQHGYDEALYRPRVRCERNNTFTIGYVGRLVSEKGLDVLLRAHASLPGSVLLNLIGDGPRRQALQQLACELGTQDRVYFTGTVSRPQLPDLYHQLDVLVLPSLTQRGGWREQFGRVLIEAMACGVPVVGSSCGAIPWVIGNAGAVTPEGDPEALAAALECLRADGAYRRRCMQIGIDRASQLFSDAAIAARTMEVYDAIVHDEGSRAS